jgi:D-lactate dehydrogenase
VYEEEEGVFFRDLSDQVLQDDTLARLLTFPNVIVTAHQAFLTQEALANIAEATLANVAAYERGERLEYEVRPERVLRYTPTPTPKPRGGPGDSPRGQGPPPPPRGAER